MASGTGTKIHRRWQSGEDLLMPLLTVRSFLEEPGHWGHGPGRLNTGQAKALGVFILLPRPLLNPPPVFPETIQRNLSSSEAGTPLTLALYHYPDSEKQRPLLAHLFGGDQRPRRAGGGFGGGVLLSFTSHLQCSATLGSCQLYPEGF